MRVETGVCRPVDDLGRIVIPAELRRTLGICIGDQLRFELDESNETIVLALYQPGCVFCGQSEEGQLVEIRGRKVCRGCLEDARILA